MNQTTSLAKASNTPKIDIAQQLEIYCSAYEFHLRLRSRLPVSTTTFQVNPFEPAPDLWLRLAIAASLRKFVLGDDPVYLPKIVASLNRAKKLSMSRKELNDFCTEFKGLRTGKTGFLSIQKGENQALTAMQIVEQLLHTNYLHADRDRDQDLWTWDDATLNLALWEGTESVLPLMNAVYHLSCDYLDREPVSESETVPQGVFGGINAKEPSDFENHAQELVDRKISEMQKVNQEETQAP